jgi:hypothetical protein
MPRNFVLRERHAMPSRDFRARRHDYGEFIQHAGRLFGRYPNMGEHRSIAAARELNSLPSRDDQDLDRMLLCEGCQIWQVLVGRTEDGIDHDVQAREAMLARTIAFLYDDATREVFGLEGHLAGAGRAPSRQVPQPRGEIGTVRSERLESHVVGVLRPTRQAFAAGSRR